MMKGKRFPVLLLGLILLATACSGPSKEQPSTSQQTPQASRTTTPLTHVVVIFQENVSFDHYFGTYPKAANPSGEPQFTAAAGTPAVDGLTDALLTKN